jgi:hypothetical protein
LATTAARRVFIDDAAVLALTRLNTAGKLPAVNYRLSSYFSVPTNRKPGRCNSLERVASSRRNPITIIFYNPAKRLEDIDLPRIGAEIGVGKNEIHAVIDLETAGGGFYHGRPKILLKPRIFDLQLTGDARDRAVADGTHRLKPLARLMSPQPTMFISSVAI